MLTGKGKVLFGGLILVFVAMAALFSLFVLPDMLEEDVPEPPLNEDTQEEELPTDSPTPRITKPPKAPDEPLIVCIDPGHGGSDPGAENGDRLEKDDTLKMALKVQALLEKEGVVCYLTRTDDSALGLAERLEFAEGKNADILVSIHRNKGGGEGLEVWIKSQASAVEKDMANSIHDRILDASGMRDRGVKRGSSSSSKEDYAMNKTSSVSCLLELGFLDNEGDNKLFDRHFTAIAEAIAEGILDAEV